MTMQPLLDARPSPGKLDALRAISDHNFERYAAAAAECLRTGQGLAAAHECATNHSRTMQAGYADHLALYPDPEESAS